MSDREKLAALLKSAHMRAREAGGRNWDLGDNDMPSLMARSLLARGVTLAPVSSGAGPDPEPILNPRWHLSAPLTPTQQAWVAWVAWAQRALRGSSAGAPPADLREILATMHDAEWGRLLFDAVSAPQYRDDGLIKNGARLKAAVLSRLDRARSSGAPEGAAE